jgi:hypothetical protein
LTGQNGLSPAERIVLSSRSPHSINAKLFLLDVTLYQIKLTKATFQNRARAVIILYRLDIDGAPHRNPDDQEVPCPHLHVYREGFGDKWATPAPTDKFPDTTCFQPSMRSWPIATLRNRR